MAVFEGPDIFLAPSQAQLDELERRYGLSRAKEGDILRDKGAWGPMLLLRPSCMWDPNAVLLSSEEANNEKEAGAWAKELGWLLVRLPGRDDKDQLQYQLVSNNRLVNVISKSEDMDFIAYALRCIEWKKKQDK